MHHLCKERFLVVLLSFRAAGGGDVVGRIGNCPFTFLVHLANALLFYNGADDEEGSGGGHAGEK